MSSRLWITLNARLRPLDRVSRYEEPLEALLEEEAPGSEVTGGGTQLSAEREPVWCDIDLDVTGDGAVMLQLVRSALERAGAPKGSRLCLDDGPTIDFGVTEGLAVYLNGTDLPNEVYATNDINELVAALLDRLGPDGEMHSYWEGPRETALYLYGPSAQHTAEVIADVLASFPLAQRCRVVPLPMTLQSSD